MDERARWIFGQISVIIQSRKYPFGSLRAKLIHRAKNGRVAVWIAPCFVPA